MTDLRMCPYTDCHLHATCAHHDPLSCGREAGIVVEERPGVCCGCSEWSGCQGHDAETCDAIRKADATEVGE